VYHGPIASTPTRHSLTTDVASISSYTQNGYHHGGDGGEGG
jgi:hypothetical protein